MGWDFETEPEFQEKLDRADRFLAEDVEPLDYVLGDPYDKTDQRALAAVRPLQQQVRDRELWTAHPLRRATRTPHRQRRVTPRKRQKNTVCRIRRRGNAARSQVVTLTNPV